jgi:uncharacterized membrane protein
MAAEWFSMSQASMLAIFGMAVGTYLTRAGGLFLMSRVRVTPRLEAFLNAIPGAIIVSIVTPAVISSGPSEVLAGAATLGVAAKTRNLPLAIAAGVLCVWLLRQVM